MLKNEEIMGSWSALSRGSRYSEKSDFRVRGDLTIMRNNVADYRPPAEVTI